MRQWYQRWVESRDHETFPDSPAQQLERVRQLCESPRHRNYPLAREILRIVGPSDYR
jgi:hypothetical protein